MFRYGLGQRASGLQTLGFKPRTLRLGVTLTAATPTRRRPDLVVVEDRVGHGVLPRHHVGPQLFHEEHLVGQRRNYAFKGNNTPAYRLYYRVI